MPLQRPRMIWDERPPSNVEILRGLEGVRSQRGLLVQIEAGHFPRHFWRLPQSRCS